MKTIANGDFWALTGCKAPDDVADTITGRLLSERIHRGGHRERLHRKFFDDRVRKGGVACLLRYGRSFTGRSGWVGERIWKSSGSTESSPSKVESTSKYIKVRQKGAKKAGRSYVPLAQQRRIQQLHIAGKSQRQISRIEKRDPKTIAKIVKSEDMKEFVRQMQERFLGVGKRAIGKVKELTDISHHAAEITRGSQPR